MLLMSRMWHPVSFPVRSFVPLDWPACFWGINPAQFWVVIY